jgi:hypothetical protein
VILAIVLFHEIRERTGHLPHLQIATTAQFARDIF